MLKAALFSLSILFTCACVGKDSRNIGQVIGKSNVLNVVNVYSGFLGPCKSRPDLRLYFFSSEQACEQGKINDEAVFIHLTPFCSDVSCEFFRGKNLLVTGKIKYIDVEGINIHGITEIRNIQIIDENDN